MIRRLMVSGAVLMMICLWPTAHAQSATALIGHWKLVEQSYELTIEFKNNGAYVALTAMGVMTGQWEVIDEAYLSTWASDQKPRQRSRFTVGHDMLVITTPSGDVLKHERIRLTE